ncbi:hypothetical protein T11_581 [Trichinella zimbabwensis]|uniref:Uncharacterized protein n=1 Tax=Trichinella zimbabwensis TaxID=268475 RepID=A0A0V1I1C3_9BILA|nr:hypothetical protein T11_581 [Trichinella zimbabwensis]
MELPNDISDDWCAWKRELAALFTIVCIDSHSPEPSLWLELHVFGDATEVAYGAVAHFRSAPTEGDVAVRFVLAKSNVPLINELNILRSEVMDAVLLAGLRSYSKIERANSA